MFWAKFWFIIFVILASVSIYVAVFSGAEWYIKLLAVLAGGWAAAFCGWLSWVNGDMRKGPFA